MKRYERLLFTIGLFGCFVFYMTCVASIPRGSWMYLIIFAPVIEELVFRYAILKMTLDHLHLRQNVYLVAIVVSFIFGMLHHSPNALLCQGVLGLVLSFVYIKTRSYWLCVLFHAGWNSMIHFGLFNLLI
jgi:membrane protease YdiL (CAAX protease family)